MSCSSFADPSLHTLLKMFFALRLSTEESLLNYNLKVFFQTKQVSFLEGKEVTEAAPYFERQDKGFQIDLIFRRADNVITLCEIKSSADPIETKVIPEVEQKCKRFSLPKGYSLERALISFHGPSKALQEAEYFDYYVDLKQILG